MMVDLPRRPREVALMYARTCNIACRHCGIESSPHNKSRMSLADARRYIVEAAAIPRFAKVTFTGGEPFLFQDDHAELIALCKQLGLHTRIVSNGFWAKHLERGLAVLSRMKEAGLSEINFSADRFHLEFMPSYVLRNALECARQLDFTRIVSFVTNSDTPPLDLLSTMYDLPRDQLVDLRPVADHPQQIEALRDRKIFVYAGGLIGLGRAAQHPDELRHFPVSFFPSQQPCGEVVNKPVIYPDGDFQACCCAGGKMKAFTVGNLHTSSLAELYAKMERRSQYQLINTYGPKELYEIIQRTRPDLKRGGKYTSICELCVRSTDGLTPEETDQIVDEAMLEKTLVALGVVSPALST
ncbi:MAG: radical SAM protein [Chloroflexi bacterium]|nr:radical SAM protein [Chloroflexota bacterium]